MLSECSLLFHAQALWLTCNDHQKYILHHAETETRKYTEYVITTFGRKVLFFPHLVPKPKFGQSLV